MSNAYTICPSCKEQVKQTAQRCPSCGILFSPSPLVKTEEVQKSKKKMWE